MYFLSFLVITIVNDYIDSDNGSVIALRFKRAVRENDKLHKPINPYKVDIYKVIDEEKEKEKIESLEWYNSTIDPYHNGFMVEEENVSMLSPLLDKLFHTLPVNLDPLIEYLKPETFGQFFLAELLDRLIITLFNEEDNRISSISTKRQVLYILNTLLISLKRKAKIPLRIVFQSINEGWIDEIYEAETEELVSS
jgi:hypothetical protein